MVKKFLFLLLCLFSCMGAHASVICIPGFLVCYHDMNLIGRVFHQAGFEVCLWNYPSREKTIRQHAKDLCEHLKYRAQKHPGERIDFVVYSVAAVILRATVNLPDCPEEAKKGRAVLIAPSNQGASLARKFRNFFLVRWVMGDKTGRELMNYSPIDMAQFGDFPETMDVMIIAGSKGSSLLFKEPNDGFVTVAETDLNTPHIRYVLPLNHSDLLKNPRSMRLARDFILSECD